MKHPAPYHDAVLAAMRRHVADDWSLLDPFGGVGRIHRLPCRTTDIEIEPEWAAVPVPEDCEGVRICGDATALPFADNTFDAIGTSPCYGNRYADSHKARDGSVRRSYTHDLRTATGDPDRCLNSNSAGVLHWGDRYRALHERAWVEAVRVLRPGGTFLLNCKDHIRRDERQYVCDWHLETLGRLGLELQAVETIPGAPGMRFGANRDARAGDEILGVLRLEAP